MTKPKTPPAPMHSGRVLVRLPSSLHGRLLELAEVEGTSLNQLILSLIAESLGRRTP